MPPRRSLSNVEQMPIFPGGNLTDPPSNAGLPEDQVLFYYHNRRLCTRVSTDTGIRETGYSVEGHTHIISTLSGFDGYDASKVSTTRKINPGFGIYGGGDLSADRELGIDFAADGADDNLRTIRASDTRLPKFVRRAVRLATTTSITLSGIGQSIDGVQVAAGDRVLVKNQTDATTNGIWVAVSNAAWTRAADSNTTALLAGNMVMVEAGATQHGQLWRTDFSSLNDTLGSTAVNFWRVVGSPSSLDPTFQRVACNTSLTLNTTQANISGCSVVMLADLQSEFEITAFADVQVTTASAAAATIGLTVDGTLQAGQAIFSAPTAGGRGTVGQVWRVAGLAASNHTFQLVGSKSANTGAMAVNVTHTTMSVRRV